VTSTKLNIELEERSGGCIYPDTNRVEESGTIHMVFLQERRCYEVRTEWVGVFRGVEGALSVSKAQGTCEEEAAFGTGGSAPFVQAIQWKAFEMNHEWLGLKSNQSHRNVHRHRQVVHKYSS